MLVQRGRPVLISQTMCWDFRPRRYGYGIRSKKKRNGKKAMKISTALSKYFHCRNQKRAFRHPIHKKREKYPEASMNQKSRQKQYIWVAEIPTDGADA
ncbi:hypothetical protein Y032_0087g2024 [Ancylostoma ceylanicum]|uniref:Uncharacterized protein n=1 Tax=Ancylostoma ceylanicum TaxID=53326 RepID=A0A016TPA0_9BILA|nr:hypothetical protein Y032_0087g2024 [Ancylostoma ceylanicum]